MAAYTYRWDDLIVTCGLIACACTKRQDELRAERWVTSMEELYLLLCKYAMTNWSFVRGLILETT